MFRDRRDAGRQLARRLSSYAEQRPVVVALPRGGVPVAAEIADALGAPLDVLVVRKIGLPWQPELGLGAVAESGIRVLNEALIAEVGLDRRQLGKVIENERAELARRVRRYRGDRPPVRLDGRVVILVDDGLATGYTARAAIERLRQAGAARVVLAVPVAAADSVDEIRGLTDDLVALEIPSWLMSIGEFYEDFGQVTDEEVGGLLERHAPVDPVGPGSRRISLVGRAGRRTRPG